MEKADWTADLAEALNSAHETLAAIATLSRNYEKFTKADAIRALGDIRTLAGRRSMDLAAVRKRARATTA